LLQIRWKQRPELPTLIAKLGVLGHELGNEGGGGVLEHHHDLEQYRQLNSVGILAGCEGSPTLLYA
jgi:hypothetical protein